MAGSVRAAGLVWSSGDAVAVDFLMCSPCCGCARSGEAGGGPLLSSLPFRARAIASKHSGADAHGRPPACVCLPPVIGLSGQRA